jgi:hypothetical protein
MIGKIIIGVVFLIGCFLIGWHYDDMIRFLKRSKI